MTDAPTLTASEPKGVDLTSHGQHRCRQLSLTGDLRDVQGAGHPESYTAVLTGSSPGSPLHRERRSESVG